MKKSSSLDIGEEFIIQSFHNGVRLITPNNHNRFDCDRSKSIAEIYKLPLNLGFLDRQSIIKSINEHTINHSGFKSVKDTLGKTVQIAASKESAKYSMEHDAAVVKAKKPIIGEENYIRLVDDLSYQAITIKVPWYDDKTNLLGVFFCAFSFNSLHSLPLHESLTLVSNLGVLNNNELNSYNFEGFKNLKKFNIYFSKRESQCLYHLIRGKTAKQIAKELKLSNRTVESYLENMKIKMGVSTKAELIERVMDELFVI